MEKNFVKKRRDLISDPASESVKRKKTPKSKKAKRKERQAIEDLEEERRLTSLLFGEESYDFPVASQKDNEEEGSEHPLFEIDRTGGSSNDKLQTDEETTLKHADKEQKDDGSKEDVVADENSPAWIDEDDADLEINLLGASRLRKLRKTRTEEAASALNGVELEQRLRQRYQSTTQITARTDWARVTEELQADHSQDDDTGLQSSSAPLLLHSSARKRLPPNTVNIMRCPDANQSDPNKSVVQAVHFHPASDADRPLLLTAGLDKTLRFFQVGAEKSEKVHGIHCK